MIWPPAPLGAPVQVTACTPAEGLLQTNHWCWVLRASLLTCTLVHVPPAVSVIVPATLVLGVKTSTPTMRLLAVDTLPGVVAVTVPAPVLRPLACWAKETRALRAPLMMPSVPLRKRMEACAHRPARVVAPARESRVKPAPGRTETDPVLIWHTSMVWPAVKIPVLMVMLAGEVLFISITLFTSLPSAEYESAWTLDGTSRALWTNPVVAIWVVLVPAAAVVLMGTPVRVGLALGASRASAAVARVVSRSRPRW